MNDKECVFRCKRSLGPRAISERGDWVDQVQGCAEHQKCDGSVRSEIRACVSDAYRALAPSALASAYCQRLVAKRRRVQGARRQGLGRGALPALPQGLQRPDDPPAAARLHWSQSCQELDLCRSDVLGDDVVWDDPDRAEASSSGASGATVTLDGRVQSEAGAPVGGASVCARDAGAACA